MKYLRNFATATIISIVCMANANAADHDFKNLTVVDHPLIEHKLTIARNVKTKPGMFRRMIDEISTLMCYEVTKDIPTKKVTITTPMTKMKSKRLAQNLVIVPILRAGWGMTDAFLRLLPNASVGHIGVYRDPKTNQPVEYLFKLPEVKDQKFIVVDPMLATGNSGLYAVQKLVDSGVKPENIVFVAIISAPEGVKQFEEKFPDVHVFTASLDEKLDENAYIVPGLGDSGDRLYGTVHH